MTSTKDASKKSGYKLRNILEDPWYCGPGHAPNALSKRLVGVAEESHKLGYVISCYAPGSFMKPHKHKVRDQVYHVLEGEGILEIDGVRHVVRKNDYAYLPAGVEHGLYNESTQDLVFVIASSPTDED